MKFVIFFITLITLSGGEIFAQYNGLEIALGMKYHDFLNSPVGKLSVEKRGKVKYFLILNDSGKIKEIKLIKSDFGPSIENVCREEIKILEFIPPPFVKKGDMYRMEVEFRFKKKGMNYFLPKRRELIVSRD